MPPALSDEENGASSGEEEIPYRGKADGNGSATAVEPEDEEEVKGDDDGEEAEEEEGGGGGGGEEEEEEEEEEEYVVEKILSHAFNGETCLYEVKWLGYEAKKDRTWEPEDNLSGASDVLHEYWEEIGGRPKPSSEGSKGKKRKGRKSNADIQSESGTPAAVQSNKKPKREKDWSPPLGSWENDVDYIDTVEESLDSKTGHLERFAYLVWANGKKTQHPLQHVYRKCPQKMLVYYESHLVFTQQDQSLNGDDKDVLMKADDY
ncbi:hypothetical protein BCR34DRAFT_576483 [Clohesyomyces aquaticus]|uniref:Chromo domain-containing protein n=1 Tax=Clohesyomyces aquaticus TaxID=1231657 RepID=A0A1Y1YP67_9PLEO|nr:hypothetical protein BCR34DRAFT_576483 [Clohesyomyces aquaticus]